MNLGLSVIGERRNAERFDQFPEFARAALADRISKITAGLDAAVLAAVPVRTGRLQGEVESGVENTANRVRGWVSLAGGSDFAKAAALEYGSHRGINVDAYRRTVTSVFGRAVAPTQQIIAAYTRVTDLVAERFLRDPLDAISADAFAQMRGAIEEAAAKP